MSTKTGTYIDNKLSPSRASVPVQQTAKEMRIYFIQLYSSRITSHPYWTTHTHGEPVPAEILGVMTRRDGIRKIDHTVPELPIFNTDNHNRICVHKRQKCRYSVGTMDQNTTYKTVENFKAIDDSEDLWTYGRSRLDGSP